MKTGDPIFIKATVLRVTGTRLDAQTADGQLIQTAVENAMTEEKEIFVGVDFGIPSGSITVQKHQTATEKPEKPKTAEKKSDGRKEHKAELNAPENKSGK